MRPRFLVLVATAVSAPLAFAALPAHADTTAPTPTEPSVTSGISPGVSPDASDRISLRYELDPAWDAETLRLPRAAVRIRLPKPIAHAGMCPGSEGVLGASFGLGKRGFRAVLRLRPGRFAPPAGRSPSVPHVSPSAGSGVISRVCGVISVAGEDQLVEEIGRPQAESAR